MMSKAWLTLLAVMVCSVHLPLDITASCISGFVSSGTLNGSHISLNFSVSCNYSSITISKILEENHVGEKHCQIIKHEPRSSQTMCFCAPAHKFQAKSRCSIQIPAVKNGKVLENRVYKVHTNINGKDPEKLFIHTAFLETAQWGLTNCRDTTTNATNATNNCLDSSRSIIPSSSSNNNENSDDDDSNNKDDNKAVVYALAVVASVAITLLVIGAIFFTLWMKKHRSGKFPPGKNEKAGKKKTKKKKKNQGADEAGPMEVDDYGYTMVHDAYRKSRLSSIAPGMPKSAAVAQKEPVQVQEMYTPVEVIQDRKRQRKKTRDERVQGSRERV